MVPLSLYDLGSVPELLKMPYRWLELVSKSLADETVKSIIERKINGRPEK